MISGIRMSRAAVQTFGVEPSWFDEQGLLKSPKGLAMHQMVSRLNLVGTQSGGLISAGAISAFIALDAAYRDVVDAWTKANPEASRGLPALDTTVIHALNPTPDTVFETLLNALAAQNPAANGRLDALVGAGLDATQLETALAAAPKLNGMDLHTFLKQPQVVAPLDFRAQVDYVVEKWAEFLRPELLKTLLLSRDRLTEEVKFGFAGGRPTSQVYTFGGDDPERFSPDKDWMPSVVLIAKNIYVWLNQLSKQYERTIERLDQIPDEELKLLAERGITGLWMIGLWERSDASRKVKQMCGAHHAVASAYSLYDYQVAQRLGGDDSYNNLKDRAWRHGVRLAADMVPNHVGIDSDWVRNHPDYLLSLPYSPFPGYSFGGQDLCDRDDLSVNIEDGYFNKTDAAVVFKRYDHNTGEERFIYHGNDGTLMPWNDTAQIDFLNPEAREAVIQKILHVARMFPIIRFDAAMTLVKKHIQRLWFPEPGTGGAIPSRADHGITLEELDRLIPKEFWAEVVDRVAQECPDTLLLAEAFWMLEGFFVRSLGMHRVYNSAFMNMLRDEKNDEYRHLMRNTLEFDPQILKRYVNFMNNPDEDTAADQFGKADKYFGICTLMATMPGLPMFGHGQVEGFSEKYGMDFAEPMLDEKVDPGFVAYHAQRIFPLLHRRRLFAEVENFYLYDLENEHGVEENVFAYSNARDGEKALVVYHNRFGDTQGWIKRSVGFNLKPDGVQQRSLAFGLELPDGHDWYACFTDSITGLQYLRHVQTIRDQGFYVELDAYRCHVFLDWGFERHAHWGELHDWLEGRGVPNLDDARLEMLHGQVYDALALWCDTGDGAAIAALWKGLEDSRLLATEPKDAPATALQRAFALMASLPEPWTLYDDHALGYGFIRILGHDAALALRAALGIETSDADPTEFASWLMIPQVQDALGIHEFEETQWVSGELWQNVQPLLAAILPEFEASLDALSKAIEDAAYSFDALLKATMVLES